MQELKDTKEASASKSVQDKEIQVELVDAKAVEEVKEKEKEKEEEEEEEDDDVFVYPKHSSENINQVLRPEPIKEEEEEEEEEVFVYSGRDAITSNVTERVCNELDTKQYEEKDLQQTEDKLKSFYQHQINNLTEKIQLTDSKALRFAQMYKSLKAKLMEEDKEKQTMLVEIERLNKEVRDLQDLLKTTDTNYRKQVDTMTEFISQLQENAEQQHQSPSRRNHNYNN